MKFYKVYIPNVTTKWVVSQNDAAAERKRLNQKGHKRDDIFTLEVEVPTTKKELLEFLNDSCV